MLDLKEINNQELVRELQERIHKHQLTDKEMRVLKEELAEILEEETWQKDYELAAQDKEWEKEAQEWENLKNKIGDE